MAGATLWEKYAHICMSLEPIKAIVYLMHLCIEIVDESETKSIEDSQVTTITAVARAYMATMGYRVMTLEDYERAISFNGIIALLKENNNFQTITIRDLIFHCHGYDYLENYKWYMTGGFLCDNHDTVDDLVQEFENEDQNQENTVPDFENDVNASMETDSEDNYYIRRFGNNDNDDNDYHH